MLSNSQPLLAQQDEELSTPRSAESEYYYAPVTSEQTYSIAQQKSILKGQNRVARLEALRKYGLTPNRPTAVAVPFTSASTLTWTRPRAGMFVYYSGYYRPYYYSAPHAHPYMVRR